MVRYSSHLWFPEGTTLGHYGFNTRGRDDVDLLAELGMNKDGGRAYGDIARGNGL